MADDDLLRPTLSGYRQAPAIHGSTGFFVAAFFGGPLGASIYGLFNSWRLGRLKQDLPLFIVLAAAAFAIVFLMQRGGQMTAIAASLDITPARTLQVALRALALACYGAIYLAHRQYFRAAQVAGVRPLSGWVPGLVALITGFLANLAFIDLVLAQN